MDGRNARASLTAAPGIAAVAAGTGEAALRNRADPSRRKTVGATEIDRLSRFFRS